MTDIAFMCCFCENAIEGEYISIGLWHEDTDAYQQWWAHPKCVRAAFTESALTDLHPEFEKRI